MITNIIRNIIKDFPSVANSTLFLFYDNKQTNEFAVTPTDNDNIIIVVQGTMKAAKFKTAAMLAYTRDYLGGMNANNRYEQEGTEALGLQTLPDTNLVGK